MPIIPNRIKIIFDKISIVLSEIFVPSHFPKKIAIESLETIPQIEPHIKENLYIGYCKPKPIEARNVLSPSSPMAIVVATKKIAFWVREYMHLSNVDFAIDSFSTSFWENFSFANPTIPNIKIINWK